MTTTTTFKWEIEACPNPNAIIVNTNFDLKLYPDLWYTLNMMTGIESQIHDHFIHRYNFLLIKGQLFSFEEVSAAIDQKLKEYFEMND